MKGFVTVATGKESYYRMAHNLLLSYRYHTNTHTPFAILCDRQNEWTEDFDQVVIIDNPVFSFYDKLRILDLSPYDETIFIDADSLVYKDLNAMWNWFKDGPDVGVLGVVYPNDSDKGWWDVNNLGELKDKVDYKMTCIGGVYYIRKNGKDLPAFRETCKYIEQHYFDYHFSLFGDVLEDETVILLASCVHHFKPVKDWIEAFAFYSESNILNADILSGTLEFEWTNFPGSLYKDSLFLHFGNTFVRYRWIYKKEVFKLKKGPVRLSNYWAYCLLRVRHDMLKILATVCRKFGIKRDVLNYVYA